MSIIAIVSIYTSRDFTPSKVSFFFFLSFFFPPMRVSKVDSNAVVSNLLKAKSTVQSFDLEIRRLDAQRYADQRKSFCSIILWRRSAAFHSQA